MLIEVAVSSVADAVAAVEAGADRLELSTAIELGGLTPSEALIDGVLEAVDIPVIALVRPRPGGFAYDDATVKAAASEAATLVKRGVWGIAFGVLNDEGWVHHDHNARIIDAIGDAERVFHRAIDATGDPYRALDELIGLGVHRVLTSGQCESAADGAGIIRWMIEHAAGRIEVCPAAGIRPRNAADIAQRTRCDQLHGTFSTERVDDAGPVCDAAYSTFDPQALHTVREALEVLAIQP